MRILLINPPVREQYPPTSFPYGLAYVAKYLLKAGHEVKILDIDTNRYNKKEVLKELQKYRCDIIGTGGIVTVYKYLKWLIPILRKTHPKAKIIVGGSLPTSAPKTTLKGLDIDFIVIGEGEINTPNLVSYLEKHKKPKISELKKIKGIGFKYKDQIIITQPQEMIKDIDELGFPPWDLFPIKKNIKYLNGMMGVLTERGCPFNCKFCYHQFGYKPRRRSMENFIKEIKILNKNYGVTYFVIVDNLFVFNKKEIIKFINLLNKNKLKIKFATSMRASLVTEELIRLLKKAGCVDLSFGFESGSQKVLDLMDKRTTVEQMDNAIKILKKYKMPFSGTFMIGYPGETEEDIDKTINFCKKHGLLAKPFFTTPYPGTPLFYEIKDKIKDMDKFLESLGDARDLIINISNFSNKELIKQRRRVVEETEKAFLKKHRILGFLFSPLRLLNIEVGLVVNKFLTTPFFPFLKNSLRILINYFKGIRVVPASDKGYDKTFD